MATTATATSPLMAMHRRYEQAFAGYTAVENAESEACGSAWKRDPVSGVIGVEKGPLILVF